MFYGVEVSIKNVITGERLDSYGVVALQHEDDDGSGGGFIQLHGCGIGYIADIAGVFDDLREGRSERANVNVTNIELIYTAICMPRHIPIALS